MEVGNQREESAREEQQSEGAADPAQELKVVELAVPCALRPGLLASRTPGVSWSRGISATRQLQTGVSDSLELLHIERLQRLFPDCSDIFSKYVPDCSDIFSRSDYFYFSLPFCCMQNMTVVVSDS